MRTHRPAPRGGQYGSTEGASGEPGWEIGKLLRVTFRTLCARCSLWPYGQIWTWRKKLGGLGTEHGAALDARSMLPVASGPRELFICRGPRNCSAWGSAKGPLQGCLEPVSVGCGVGAFHRLGRPGAGERAPGLRRCGALRMRPFVVRAWQAPVALRVRWQPAQPALTPAAACAPGALPAVGWGSR